MKGAKKIKELVGIAGTERKLAEDIEISGITEDSRQVKPGYCFVAIRGIKTDGHKYVADAIKRGARVVIVEKTAKITAPIARNVLRIEVDDSREALARLAQAFYGFPAKELTVIGVTGTSGKTTTTYLLESICKAAGREPGVIGTINYRWGKTSLKASQTTPPAPELAKLIRQMREEAQIKTLVMEVSSHSIDQRRIDGIRYDVGIYTNISFEHLDYHKTMADYIATKWRFFAEYVRNNPQATSVFNIDDNTGKRFFAEYEGNKISYALHNEQANLVARKWSFDLDGMRLETNVFGRRVNFTSSLLGEFNIYNILSAIGGSWAIGISLDEIVRGVASLGGVPGRLERIDCGQSFLVIVDYSHKAAALAQALRAVKSLKPQHIITVFGCGGDRDRQKRPLMGKIAAKYSDYVILTSDNPRSEDPEMIMLEAEQGIIATGLPAERYKKILERKAAIFYAINLAQEKDCVLIAGKGHEDYQITGNEVIHFDDREIAKEAIYDRLGAGCRS